MCLFCYRLFVHVDLLLFAIVDVLAMFIFVAVFFVRGPDLDSGRRCDDQAARLASGRAGKRQKQTLHVRGSILHLQHRLLIKEFPLGLGSLCLLLKVGQQAGRQEGKRVKTRAAG